MLRISAPKARESCASYQRESAPPRPGSKSAADGEDRQEKPRRGGIGCPMASGAAWQGLSCLMQDEKSFGGTPCRGGVDLCPAVRPAEGPEWRQPAGIREALPPPGWLMFRYFLLIFLNFYFSFTFCTYCSVSIELFPSSDQNNTCDCNCKRLSISL
jgi:hypothetical protein